MHTAATRQSTCLAEKAEQRVLESNQLNEGATNTVDDPDIDLDPPVIMSRADGQSLCICVERAINLTWLV